MALLSAAVGAQEREILIRVLAPDGASVVAAEVRVTPDGRPSRVCEESEDGYLCRVPEDTGARFDVNARGFKPFRMSYGRDALACCEYVFVLHLSGPAQTVTVVTGTAGKLIDTPESVSVISRERLGETTARTLDSAAKQIPDLMTFRRSDSTTSNPTTQGVSLRGIGASGASRALVLYDGLPLNDPFGGWVQWTRIPQIAVDRVEVLAGGASSIYGDSSLAGAVEIVPRSGEKPTLSGEAYGGSGNSYGASGFAGGAYGRWSADLSVGMLHTDGYIPVEESARGSADSTAGAAAGSFIGTMTFRPRDDLSFYVRPMYFGEARTNGTLLQSNRTHSRSVAFGGRAGTAARKRNIRWTVYGGTQVYDQSFSAVSADRDSESLTRLQRSPSQFLGIDASGAFTVGRHLLAGGFDARTVRGSSDEIGYSGGIATVISGAGGRERSSGAWIKDVVPVGSRLVLSAGVRYDGWRNYAGNNASVSLTDGTATYTQYPARSEDSWSPQISLLFQATKRLGLTVSASRSFRAPVLNELYRGFRVGNVVTLANPALTAEHANSFEAGGRYELGTAVIRANAFITDVDDAVANITVTSSPALVMRERRNAGKILSRGISVQAETKIWISRLTLGYSFIDSVVKEIPSEPALIGKRVPQVPRHQFTFQSAAALKGWNFAVQGRAASAQFDDDQNLFRLEPFFQADLFVSRRLGKASFFAAAENIFNSRYSIGRTPVRTVSSPFVIRAGVRWN